MRLRQGCRGWWIALLAALADRLTKAVAARLPAAGGTLIPGLVKLTPVENRGVAFSMFSGQNLPIVLGTAALIAGIIVWLIARPDAPKPLRAGLWLIVGGGLGNLYDRLTLGGVSDFIELAFMRFAVFNVADVCICVGAALAIIGTALAPDGPRAGDRQRGADDAGRGNL